MRKFVYISWKKSREFKLVRRYISRNTRQFPLFPASFKILPDETVSVHCWMSYIHSGIFFPLSKEVSPHLLLPIQNVFLEKEHVGIGSKRDVTPPLLWTRSQSRPAWISFFLLLSTCITSRKRQRSSLNPYNFFDYGHRDGILRIFRKQIGTESGFIQNG